MAGMLPGVELARKRRIHHHRGGGVDPMFSARRPAPAAPRPEHLRPPTYLGEEALLARSRLEKKLHRFGLGSEAAQSTAASRYAPPRDGGSSRSLHTPIEAPAASTRTGSAARTKNPPQPPPSAAAAAAALERTESSGSECAVCLDGLRDGARRPVLNLPCAHRYHWDCLLRWLAAHPSCPCCRTPVAAS